MPFVGLKRKLVCNSVLVLWSAAPSARSTRNCFDPIVVFAGKAHFVKLAGSSLRYKPPRVAAAVPELYSSIHGLRSPEAFAIPEMFSASTSFTQTRGNALNAARTEFVFPG